MGYVYKEYGVRLPKVVIAVVLVFLVLVTIGIGIYFEHYFVVAVFGVWLCIEYGLQRLRGVIKPIIQIKIPQARELLKLYNSSDVDSSNELRERIHDLLLNLNCSKFERGWLLRLNQLNDLRSLVYHMGNGQGVLREAFAYRSAISNPTISSARLDRLSSTEVSVQDVTESATIVSDLYWKLFEAAQGQYPELVKPAKDLFREIFGVAFEPENARNQIERLTDCMQRDRGFPFLILNLIRSENISFGRQIAQGLLREFVNVEMDEGTRSSLYWVSEIHWFARESRSLLTDYESCIRYLYHICFTNPERAGLLEIDSQFYSQFELVEELAREGFLFKETLIEKILLLWKEQDKYFDSVFEGVLVLMTQQKNKIYDTLTQWERFWRREKTDFSRDYLYVVEGNLSYASGEYADARSCYEKAQELNPRLRPALLNLLFVYARTGAKSEHQALSNRLVENKVLYPAVLYNIGDSFLLLGDEGGAEAYYKELEKYEGWAQKVDYYKSTFCFEHGLFGQALKYAQKAYEKSPEDRTINYQLSICYSAMGEKGRALDMVKKLGDAPQWLTFYRFTLERDVGEDLEASRTLLRLPLDYFEDEDELQAAVEFAKSRQDLVLLRHLRKKET